jgi:hypothetical protein
MSQGKETKASMGIADHSGFGSVRLLATVFAVVLARPLFQVWTRLEP